MVRIIFLALLSLLSGSCSLAQFKYQRVPASILPGTGKQRSLSQISQSELEKAIDVTRYLPANFDKTARVDYTSKLQAAIDKGDIIILPDCPLLINKRGLLVRSNKKIVFQRSTVFQLEPNNLAGYNAILIENSRNVEIWNPRIVGDRLHHRGKEGEWGMGVSIINSQFINIFGGEIKNMWGDGIYIGGKGKGSSDVKLDGVFLDNNRRNGVSIVSGKNIKIADCVIANTNGTNPQSGIDIEPNENSDILNVIQISNLVTYNNYRNGLMIVLDNLNGIRNKVIDISISSHKDLLSETGLNIYIDRGYKKRQGIVSGNITAQSLNYSKNRAAGLKSNAGRNNSINFLLSNLTINNKKIDSKKLSDYSTNFIKKGKAFDIK